MSFGATPLSTTTLGPDQFPASAVAEPGHANGDFTALEGGPGSVDSNNNRTAPMSIYVKDGGDTALGTTTDLSTANTLIGLTKAIKTSVASVTIGTLPALVAGSAVIGGVELVDSGGTNKASISAGGAIKVDGSTVTQPVSGTFWQATQPISAASLPLPSGASTSAKQPALGTAGNASADVLSVQGIASMTPLKTDGSAVTQPVSIAATVTVSATNLQTNLNQIAGSNVATAATGIIKVGMTDGTGTALTSTSNALDVNIKSGGGSGFSVVDEASWTAGTSAMIPAGGVFNDSAAALTSGQEGTVRLTNNRAIHVNLRDASANQLLGSKTSANSIPVVIASDQGAVAVSGTFWQTTQPVSGTVTANIGTSGSLALDTSVNGILVSQGSTTSGEKGPMVQGAVTTNAPSYTTAQTSPLSLDTSGLLRASLKDTPSNTNNLNVNLAASAATVTVSGSVTANAGTNLNTSALALETGGNLATLAGAVSSSKVQVNTAQINGVAPTMGNGVSGTGVQRVTIASDSTGQVTLASGANTIGAVTQASGPWTENLTQIAGSSVSTAATGVQKVGIVGNGGATVDSTVGAGTAPTNAIVAGSVYNTSAPAPTNGQAMAVQADQAGNTRTFPGIALATLSAWNSSTALNATQNIFTNSGAEAVLVQLTQTTTLTGGAVTFEVSYDNSNWSTIPANCVIDPSSTTFAQISLPYTVQASTNKAILINMNGAQALRIKLSTQISGTGTVTPNYALLPASPADTVVALSPTAANFNVTIGTGANTIGAVTQASGPWTNNITQFGSSNVVTGTGAGGSGIPRVTISNDSNVLATQSGTWTVQPGNTANTTPWLVQTQVGVSGGSTPYHNVVSSGTNGTNVKASAGQVYDGSISNTSASAVYFRFYDTSGTPTVGTTATKRTIQIPSNGTVILSWPNGLKFTSGIAWGITTAIADNDTTAIGSSVSIDFGYI